MYQTAKALSEPKNSRQMLWRYLAEDRLVDILESEEIFFTHLPKFSDGLEGTLTNRSREHLIQWFINQGSSPRNAVNEVNIYEKNASSFYANCWHMNNHESFLMWRAYADRGYAICTHFERLKAAFLSSECAVSAGVIEYVDFQHSRTKVGNVFNQVSTKDLPYEDERELRLFLWREDQKNYALNYGEIGIRVKVDVKMLIRDVLVNPAIRVMSPKVKSLLESRGIESRSSVINHRNTQCQE